MANKQKLELAWIEKENRPCGEPRISVQFPEDPGRPDSPLRSYEAVLDICGGPRCPCLNIRFVCRPLSASLPAASALPPREFWLDLRNLSTASSPELQKDPEAQRLAELILAELTESGQQQLREWYLAAKLDLIQSTPISHIDIADLPNADGGKMIGFVDVFPCGGLALNFRHGNEAWAVDEQYCVQSGCRCSETVLSFFRLVDAAGKKTEVIRQAPTLRYNYASETTKLLERPAGMPSPQELLIVLKGEHPDVNVQLERRHLIMQLLYVRHYQAQDQARIHHVASALAFDNLLKIGRNDPCPCGSGRKYKHCCLNKPRP
jgi:hypothetical protein